MYIFFSAFCAMGWGMDKAWDLGRSTAIEVSVGMHFRRFFRHWWGFSDENLTLKLSIPFLFSIVSGTSLSL